jgi:hypothetical protein
MRVVQVSKLIVTGLHPVIGHNGQRNFLGFFMKELV